MKRKLRIQLQIVLNGKTMKKTQYAAQMIICVAPAGVPENESHNYFDFLAHQIMEVVGECNFIQMWVRVDEIHDYIDSDTKGIMTSLPHCHTLIIPAVEYETKKCFTDTEKQIRKRERAEAKAKGLKWNADSDEKLTAIEGFQEKYENLLEQESRDAKKLADLKRRFEGTEKKFEFICVYKKY